MKGPSSPYEASFHSMVVNSGHLRARIQQDSVNTVVLNTEPQEKHERVMIAAHVTLSASGSNYVARDTTLLPSIPGLPHLLCLLFAPSVEMRWGMDGSRDQWIVTSIDDRIVLVT